MSPDHPIFISPVPEYIIGVDTQKLSEFTYWFPDPWIEGYYGWKGPMEVIGIASTMLQWNPSHHAALEKLQNLVQPSRT